MQSKWLSRKLVVGAVAFLVLILQESIGLNIPEETQLFITGIIMAYLVAQGWVDAQQ